MLTEPINAYFAALQALEDAQIKMHNAIPGIVRTFREANDLTQRELAILLDVDFTYISRIENGHAVPGKPFLRNLLALS